MSFSWIFTLLLDISSLLKEIEVRLKLISALFIYSYCKQSRFPQITGQSLAFRELIQAPFSQLSLTKQLA